MELILFQDLKLAVESSSTTETTGSCTTLECSFIKESVKNTAFFVDIFENIGAFNNTVKNPPVIGDKRLHLLSTTTVGMKGRVRELRTCPEKFFFHISKSNRLGFSYILNGKICALIEHLSISLFSIFKAVRLMNTLILYSFPHRI